jgi:hypothetical protein
MAVALTAVVLAAGGTSYAAAKLPNNSVGTPQLKNRAVTAAKLGNDAVTGKQLNESTLGTVPTATSAGIAGLSYPVGDLPPLPAHMGATVHADCPNGLSVVGGGIKVANPATQYIVDGYPQGSGWTANFVNAGDAPAGGTLYLICAQGGAAKAPAKSALSPKLSAYRRIR